MSGLDPTPLAPEVMAGLALRTAPRRPVPQQAAVTSRLRVRMTEADRELTRSRMTGDLLGLWRDAPGEPERTRIELAAVAALGLAEVAARLGFEPEPGHAFAHGGLDDLLATTLDARGADLVTDILAAAGVRLEAGATLVDAGGSARRAALALALGDVAVLGRAAPPGASADLVVDLELLEALGAGAAVEAIGALRRVVAVGGHLVLAGPGLAAFARDTARGARDASGAAAAVRDLYRTGHHRAPDRSYVTLDWVGAHLVDPWSIVFHAPAGLEDHRDVTVLQRRR